MVSPAPPQEELAGARRKVDAAKEYMQVKKELDALRANRPPNMPRYEEE